MDRTEQLKASPPLFASPLLDRFTRVHPVVPALIYAPVILVLALTGAERLRELHMRHHFQDDESGFGVSAPYWDRVFGTRPERPRR